MKSKLLKSIFISLILVMGVNNAWADYTWYSGDLLYYDFSAVSGGVNWHDGSNLQYDVSGGRKVKKVEFSSTVNMDNTWVVAKTGNGNWAEIKFTNPPSANQRRFIINSDGQTASWGYLDKYIAGDNWGGIGSWSTTTKKMTNNNNGTYTINFTSITASAHEFKIVNYDTWTGAIGHSENVSCINGTVTNRDGNIKFTPYIEGDVTITYDVSTGKTVITCATASVSATITPTVGTTGTNNLTFSITSNVPTNSGYHVGVYNFGENDYASGYINGDKEFTSNPTSYTATYNQNTAGTYYTRAFVIKDSEILAKSEKIAFTVNAGSSASTVSEWKMYNGDTELGTFTNEGNDTYTLTITIPEGGYAQTNYRNNLGNIGTPGASSLLNNEQQLTINNGRLPWQDGAGTFTITIRKDGETWKISAIKQSTNKNIYLVGQFNGWKDNDNNYKFEETEPGIYTLTKHFYKRERYNATDASQAEWEFKLLVDGTKYTVEGEGAAKVLQYTRQNTTKVLSDGHPYGSDPYYNLLLQADQTGNYVFTYNANTQVLTVTHPEYSPSASYIVGDFSDGANGTDATPKDGGAGKDWTEEYGVRIDNNSQVCFPNGASWNFKIKINGIWYGAENLVISESGTYILSDDYADAGQRNCAILTSVSGCYNFSYVDNGNGTITLTVGYPEVETTPIYLKPNSNWKADNARFAAYLFGNGETWVDMKEVGCSGIYTCDIPAGYPNIIFCRMNPSSSNNNFNDGVKWNQTGDLTIPTDGTNQYTVKSGTWDKGGGTWETYSPNIEISLNHGDNGTIKLSPSSPVTINTEVTVTMTPNEGYTFESGTIEIGNQEQQISTTTSTHTICGPTSITAQWTPNTYYVAFNANTGTGAMEQQTFQYATSQNLKANEFTKTGYTFTGWNTAADGSGDSYTDQQSVNNLTTENGATITLYAQWTPTVYNITYKDQGDVEFSGTHEAGHPTQHTYDSDTQLKGAGKMGCTFLGWFTNKECTEGPITTLGATAYTTNITLYAKWEIRNLYIHADFVNWNGILVEPEFKNNSVVYTYTGILEEDASSYNNEHTIWDGGHHFHYLYSLEGIEEPATQKIAYNYYNVDAGNISYTQDLIDAVHLTDDNNPTIQFGLTKKSRVTITLTLVSDIETDDKATQPDVAIVAIPCNTITLDQTGARTQGTVTSVEVPNGDPMPAITGDGALPTPQIGYTFMGYFDQKDGKGTQYYKADGTSELTWDKTENTTLYAYFKKAEISIELNASTFEPGTASVTATATVTPAPADGTTVICWSLLYSGSENEVAGHEPTPTNGNSVQFSISDLAAGSYTIKAILREGTGCEGTEISSATKTFLITSSHTITIKYTCDGKEIQASTTQEAQVSSATTITAPDIFGYTFSNWEAGDGVTINGNTSSRTITYTAIYDGYLTAKYNVNNNIVYFKNTLGWNKVYVYTFSNNAWWDTGSVGVHPEANKLEQGEMIRMGDTDIYYFALSNPNSNYTQDNNANKNYIAFSNQDWRGKDAFNGGKAIYRGDHKNNLTLFIPQVGQTPETHNGTQYYSTGIWMKYNSTESGYQLAGEVPNDDPTHDGWGTWGNKFTAPQPGNYIFTITKHLNANTTYKFKIKNYVWVKDYSDKDNNQWFGNSGTMTSGNCTGWHFKGDNDEGENNGDAQITTNAAGEYKFIIDLSQGKVLLSVEYPIAVGDYRVIYKDNATWSQGTTAHDANWYHPSRIIKKNKTNETTKDIISFFISHGNNPTMKFQKVTSITNGNVTWEDAGAAKIPDNITKPGVYNFIVTQTANGTSISMEEQAEPYTGNYYIRCDAVGGKWDNYKTDKENRMTYSAFSESEANSFGQKYSHYVTKYCPYSTNIKFTIANDYSPCISDTLVRDFGANNTVNPFGNLDENGTLIKDGGNNDKYSANVRFMWNHKTNKISRAYIGRAVTNDFLVITGNKKLQKSDGSTLRDTIVFFDTQNWIYEVKMKVQPTTRVKVYAAYPTAVGETKAQYFCGAYNNDAFNNDEDSKLALGGDANDQNYYSIRVLYDFKTNRLLMAWMPSGDTENVTGTKTISADVMLIRDHQNPAQCITFANEDSKLSEVKTVYGSMRFNRWILNNRGGQNNFDVNSCGGADYYDESKTNTNHPVLQPAEQKSQYERALYFISFPFDVNVSDIFGFGTYGQHWIIEYYDGLKRAREGYWIDSDPNWKYVTNPDEFVLEKYKGYILCLNLGKMAYNNTDFWAHNISQVELFFPSTTTMSEIKRTEVTMPELGDEYLCKINRNTPEGDRRVKDSYWRCIGVPSYANYSNILTDGEQQTIKWQTSYTTFPFLYAWNMTDNTLTPQSTTNFNFKTMHAYLVQNGGEIHWSAVSATPNQPSNIVARRQAADEVKNYEWKLTLSRNEQIEDQAFVRLSNNEQITTEFDFNQDLSKEFNYGRSDIYTLIGYEKAAANSLPITETTTLIPLGLSIEYNGDYTIAMPDRMENIGVTLIDTESNTRTNLSAGMEYVVTLNKGDYNNRFFIEISPAHQVPTDIEYVTGDSNNQDSVRKVLIDNILYIVRDGQIFDARGARVQ